MKIYTEEMLKRTPRPCEIMDDIETRGVMTPSGEKDYEIGCGAIALANAFNFYGKSFLEAPTLKKLLMACHFALEETQDGGLVGNKLLNVLRNENLNPRVFCYPKEEDFLLALRSELQLGFFIHFDLHEQCHIQILRRRGGVFLYGNIELNLNDIMKLAEVKAKSQKDTGRTHHWPSVLISTKWGK